MSEAVRVCEKCGSKILADAPQGFCSLCLFKAALQPKADETPEANAARVAKEFGDYEILQEIGRGGQGIVYRARQKSLNRLVALKVIGVGAWATELHLGRFRREAEAAGSLNHPSIVPIHEIGEREGCCYYSMNLIEGGQLDEVIGREALPPRRAAELIAKLARTVDYTHEHGILHRDIKPGNILLDHAGELYLTDFGLARLVESESNLTRSSDVLGTPSYIAPEQASGNESGLSRATDVYGLGAVLYFLLTRQPPFLGASTYETLRLAIETEARPPHALNPKVDRELSTICLKCLEKAPEQRYPTALALAEDLERWLRHEPVAARPSGLATRGRKWIRRDPAGAVAVILGLALLVIAGTALWRMQSFRPPAATGIAVLSGNTTGSGNIAIGDSAGINLTTGKDNIDIGNKGVAGESNTIRLGKKGTQIATYIAGISGTTVPGGVSVLIDSNGRLGTMNSSARYKENIRAMNQASESILSLQRVTFRYKKELDPDAIQQFGLVAEEVAKVAPELVARDSEGKPYTVRYEPVSAMLLNEFLKEHRKVEEQRRNHNAATEANRCSHRRIAKG